MEWSIFTLDVTVHRRRYWRKKRKQEFHSLTRNSYSGFNLYMYRHVHYSHTNLCRASPVQLLTGDIKFVLRFHKNTSVFFIFSIPDGKTVQLVILKFLYDSVPSKIFPRQHVDKLSPPPSPPSSEINPEMKKLWI